MAGNTHDPVAAAWAVVEASAGADGYLRAAAESQLYPHVWTRDVGMAALGIVAAHRGQDDIELVARSLELIASCQDELGRIPLKVDPRTKTAVRENSSWADSEVWFVIAASLVYPKLPEDRAKALASSARRALAHTKHLDCNGDQLLETPEASDWADMMPHRHQVLYVNSLYAAALRCLGDLDHDDQHRRESEELIGKMNMVFRIENLIDADQVAAHLPKLARVHPEAAITGRLLSAVGDLPFYLPYVGFRTAGRHCDIVGNLVAIVTGVADRDFAERILDHLDAVGASQPVPTKTIDPPLYPGDPDYRDHFHWRQLNVPHQYQNGGAWPFIGGLHVVALACAGRHDQAKELLGRLASVCCDDRAPFPEWCHGKTGKSMGQPNQLWSATGYLLADAAVRGALDAVRQVLP